MNACTIIARNYLAHARVLAESFLAHNPGGRFTVLLLDDLERAVGERGEPFEILHPAEIGIEEAEFHRMATVYDILELATAVKPWLLRTLLDEGAADVIFLDPDVQVFAPLDDISRLAQQHSIVLTPHTTEPLPRDGLEPSERTLLRAGMFNLGFIAVGSGAHEFLDWWAVRLRRDCLNDPGEGQFVDQRWVDFVNVLFDHHVLTDPGYNVATWNLTTRDVEWDGERYLVGDKPLRFFHFSGFSADAPHLLSKFQGPTPRILLSERPVLARLCRDYAQALRDRGYGEWSPTPYAWNALPDGRRLDRPFRRLYRNLLVDAERNGHPLPPDPFDPASAEVFGAWRAAVDGRPGRRKLAAYARALYAVDPEALPARAALRVRNRLRARRLDPGPGLEKIPHASRPGVNVAGYFRAELGVGEAARQLVAALEAAGIPHATVTYDRTPSRQEHTFSANGASALYDVNIVCVNADQMLAFRRDMGLSFFAGRYTIGVWFWEISEFPTFLHPTFGNLDEVWVASDFVREAVAAATRKPVLTMPLPVRLPDPPALAPVDVGLPEGFLFLFSFDFLSVFERKNPLGLLEAFSRAFAPGEGPTLFLKSINGHLKVGELERLRLAAAARPDVVVLDGYLSSEEKNALAAGCDCYVSLHRSEGFGLTMAEAMAYGKPVIATAYSGNLAFMTDENSYLVPWRPGSVPAGCDPYPVGAEWAEPDLDEAARLMRRVWEKPNEAAERGQAARETIETGRSLERMGEWAKARLAEIRLESGARRKPPRLVAEASVLVAGMRMAAARARQASATRAPPAATGPPVPTDDPSAAAVSSLERAHAFVAQGPVNEWRSPSPRLGAAGVFSRRVLHRLLRPYLVRQREFETAVVEALGEAEERDEAQKTRLDALKGASEAVSHQLAEVVAQLTAVPYAADPSLLRTKDAEGREEIGYSADRAAVDNAGVYRGFEEIFRGPEAFIKERQRSYVALVEGNAPVLDVGCGRGEFLDLLAAGGIDARGVDADPEMVARSREKGHDVELADACEYLAGLADGSLGTVFSAQVIEHLGYEDLVRFYSLAHEKLVSGGLLIAETINPHSIQAFKAFWVDPTHRGPIFPEVAVALCRLHGFTEARVLFPLGTGDLESDRRTQGEYAVVARR